jgi:GntR family transcriptional regulator, transcriptional repressor for pyruvate dehydrogenase complex
MTTDKKSKSAPRGFSAKRLAKDLRKELLARKSGEFFGFEDDLLSRLNVSRPTLRQAARVLEHDQLLSVRRGPRGGYYVTRPDVQWVINAASLYLYERGTRLRDLIVAARGCVATLVRGAAECPDEGLREELRRQLQVYASTDFKILPYIEFLHAENAFVTLFARMAGNAPLELVIQILYGCGLGVTTDKIFEGRPERIEACAQLRIRLVEAVLANDGELAQLLDTRSSDLRRSYLEEDDDKVKQSSADKPPSAAAAVIDIPALHALIDEAALPEDKGSSASTGPAAGRRAIAV